MYQLRQNGSRATILLEDIISERRKGKSGAKIAEALTIKYGINITESGVQDFLSSLDPPRKLSDFDSPEKSRTKLFTLEDIISERKLGKRVNKIAEALTNKYSEYGVNITGQDILNFLHSFDPPKKLRDFDSPERARFKLFTLDDIITERKKGKSVSKIAEALTNKYGINITVNDIKQFLIRFDPPKKLSDFDSPERHKFKLFTLDDIITERKKGKSIRKIAEALTIKYGINITVNDINKFLNRFDPPKKLSDFDYSERHRFKLFTLDDIITERKKGKSGSKIAEVLTNKYGINITLNDIYAFLRTFDPPKKLSDFDSRSNPLESRTPFQNTVSTSFGLGSSMAIAKVLDMKYPTMSGTKRSLIAGGVPAGVSLGIYAKTKDEAALWGLAGSVIGTALSAYLFRK